MLIIQNINLNDVLFLFPFQFLFIVLAVVAVVYYLRRAIRTFIATSLLCMWRRGVCAHAQACACNYVLNIYGYISLDGEVHFLS